MRSAPVLVPERTRAGVSYFAHGYFGCTPRMNPIRNRHFTNALRDETVFLRMMNNNRSFEMNPTKESAT